MPRRPDWATIGERLTARGGGAYNLHSGNRFGWRREAGMRPCELHDQAGFRQGSAGLWPAEKE
jgi:hypothetical protein